MYSGSDCGGSRSETRSRSREPSRTYERSPSRDCSRRSRSNDDRRSDSHDRGSSECKSHSKDQNRRSRSRHKDSGKNNEKHHDRHRSRSHSEGESETLKMYWRMIKENFRNFDAWTHLLSYVEQLDKTRPAREAYDEFLSRYPFCYGYWRKYAEFERRHKHIERCVEVYDRGVAAVSLSVDLWLHYVAFIRVISEEQNTSSVDMKRAIYKRAIEACGLEFRSDKLWEDYIHWEIKYGDAARALVLFDAVLSTPTSNYKLHFERLEKFVSSEQPDAVLSAVEYEEILTEIEGKLKNVEEDESPPLDASAENNVQQESSPPNGREELESANRKRNSKCSEAVVVNAMRREILDRRRVVLRSTEKEVARRWTFEENIKRPYFHVKPLEEAQLRNWKDYLDFEIGRGNQQRIIVLFERCMIACALYEDMWLKYANYLESISDVEGTRKIYRRAAETHLPRHPGIHLAFSAFEEKHGNFDRASDILSDFEKENPGFVIVSLRRIGIERRRADAVDADNSSSSNPSSIAARYEQLIHDPVTPQKLASFYALKLARFHSRKRGDRKMAMKVVRDAISRDKDNSNLYLALIDLAFSASSFKESVVLEAIDFALESRHLNDREKIKFSQRKLDFLEDFGTDIRTLQQHTEYHAQLLKDAGINKAISKDKLEKSIDEPAEKRGRIDQSAPFNPYTYPQQPYYNIVLNEVPSGYGMQMAQPMQQQIAPPYYYGIPQNPLVQVQPGF